MMRGIRWGWLVLACAAGVACGDDARRIEVPQVPYRPPADAGGVDAGPTCSSDEDCDDGIECTVDLCLPGGQCYSVGDNSRCSDGLFCNGLEACDPTFGCRAGAIQTCNDDNVCTIDRCNESLKTCEHRARDVDGDGEVDFRCFGGTDCNDLDPGQGSLVAEVCNDGIDNDCDGIVDEDDCGGPPHDTCDDALVMEDDGAYLLSLRGARSDYLLSCGGLGQRDVVARFSLTQPADVRVEAEGLWVDGSSDVAAVELRRACDDVTTESTCATGFPASARVRALAAGDYVVVASSTESVQQILLRLTRTAATQAPLNMTCESPQALASVSRVDGDFVNVADNYDLSCGFPGSPDLTYAFELTEVSDVVVSTYNVRGERISVSLRTDCDDPDSELRCITGTPSLGRFRALEPGQYFLVVEGPFSTAVDFSLDVRTEPPTAEPPGDSCDTAIDLPLATTVAGTLNQAQDRVPTCGFFYRDAVYSVEVSEASDLRVVADAAGGWLTMAVQSECGVTASQLMCSSGAPVSTRLRDIAPGRYAVIVEATSDVAFTLRAETLPRTVPVAVANNDTCATAFDVPDAGGLFVGSTALMVADYKASCGGPAQSNDVVYRLVLPEAKRVRASLDGAYDTVLYRFHNPADNTPAVCVPFGESACSDDVNASTRSELVEMLAAGTHYYVVSGFGGSSNGNYTIEFDITDNP